MEVPAMISRFRSARPNRWNRLARLTVGGLLLLPLAYPSAAAAQGTAQAGSIAGRVVDEQGAPIANAQVYIVSPALSAQTRSDGGYVLSRVPVGTHTLRARLLGFRPES